MKRTFVNDLNSSLVLWIDHLLLSEGQAFRNVGSKYYPTYDDQHPSYTIFTAPYKQIVYDSSISGAIIPSGVYINGNYNPRGTGTLSLDFQNDRAIFQTGSKSWNVSGNFSVKDFNIYTTTKSDEELVFDKRIDFYSEFPIKPTGFTPDKIVAPAIFIRMGQIENDPFTFGGEYNTSVNFKAIILADSDYMLSAVGNILADQKNKNFQLLPITPFNELYDLKSGYFNYNEVVNQYYDSRKMVYVESVDYTRVTAALNTKNPDMQVGIVDFTLSLPRII